MRKHTTREIRDTAREAWGSRSAERWWQDARYALRMMRRNPGFSAVAILTLALGIAVTTAILTVVNALVLRSLPFADADRLVVLFATTPKSGVSRDTTSFFDFTAWQQSRALSSAAAYRQDPFILAGDGAPEPLRGLRASHELLTVLGVNPVLGRGFTVEEQRGNHPVALISHGLWTRRYAGDPNILTRTIVVNDVAHTVVGVLPRGFQFPAFQATDLIVPVPERPCRGCGYIRAVARLRTDVAVSSAQQELDAIALGLERAFPDSNAGRGVNVVRLQDVAVGSVRTPLFVLLGAGVCVLLIGCGNVGSLVLARGIARQQELAVRSALGAGTGPSGAPAADRKPVTLFDGCPAWRGPGLLGKSTTRRVARDARPAPRDDRRLRPAGFCRRDRCLVGAGQRARARTHGLEIRPHAFSEAGRAHAIRWSGAASPPRSAGRRADSAHRRVAGRRRTPGAQLRAAHQVDVGMNARQALTADLMLSRRDAEAPRRNVVVRQLLDSLGAVPGVQAVAVYVDQPFLGGGRREAFRVEGHDDPQPDRGHPASFNSVSAQFFQAMDIPDVTGRLFDARDTAGSAPVAIVNETMARRFWPMETAVGKRVRFYYDKEPNRWLTIVGVVRDVRYRGRLMEPAPQVFVPTEQPFYRAQGESISVVVRTSGDPAALSGTIRSRIREANGDLAILKLQLLEQTLGDEVAEPRIYTLLLSVFALSALVIATAGIYGMSAYAVVRRTREIGIRMAMGATPAQILGLVLRNGMGLSVIGVGIGIAAALA